jgi:thioesterase domain-containing protein
MMNEGTSVARTVLPAHQKSAAPSLVLLKAGGENCPVFLAHGLGGTVNEFRQLANHLQVNHPIYGLPEKGADGLGDPLDRIEDMAQFHLGAIRQLQAQGPYFLIGYSLGGLVSLEIAQRLSEAGERVALLAMVDSYPDRRYLSLSQRLRLFSRLARWRTSLVRAGAERNESEAREGRHENASDRSHSDESTARVLARIKECQRRAWRNYRPQFYGGKINFVKAEIPSSFPADPVAIWAPLSREFEIESVSSDHVGLLTTHTASVARVLSRYLAEAAEKQA